MCALLLTERHAEMPKQCASVLVVTRRGHERDVETLDLVDPVVVDLREDDLLADTERVVPAAVEGLRAHTAEVAHARERQRNEAIRELPHAVFAERHHAPDRRA